MIRIPNAEPTTWHQRRAWVEYANKLFRFYSRKGTYSLRLVPGTDTIAAVNSQNRMVYLNPDFVTASPSATRFSVRCEPQGERQRIIDNMRGYVSHEAAHVRFSSDKPDAGILGRIWNSIEDERIERLMSERYADLADVFTYLGDVHLSRSLERGLERSALAGVLLWRWAHDHPLQPWTCDDPTTWDAVRPIVELAWRESDPRAVAQHAQRILDLLQLPSDAPIPATMQDSRSLSASGNEGRPSYPTTPASAPTPNADSASDDNPTDQPSDAAPKGAVDGSATSTSDQADATSDDQAADSASGSDDTATDDPADATSGEQASDSDQADGGDAPSDASDRDDGDDGDADPQDQLDSAPDGAQPAPDGEYHDSDDSGDSASSNDVTLGRNGRGVGNDTALDAPEVLPDEAAHHHARAILQQVEGYARELGQALTLSDAPRVRTSHETRGRFDYGRYASNAQRVFRRKTAPGPKRMPRITVLHDISGSMGPANDPSQSQYHALRATMMLQRACELARTPFRLIAFDGSSSDLTRDTRDAERIRARIGELRSRGGTRLAPALRLALETPTPRDERHAVIIYCDGHIVGPDATTCHALARAHPEVFILPVLIGPDVLDVEFDNAFGRSMLVPDSNDLPTVLRTWIATNLQGHGR